MRFLKRYFVLMLLLFGRFLRRATSDRWVSGAATGMSVAGLGATQLLSLMGISAVAHSSGAAILTGAGGYLAGTYGLAAAVALITAPLAILVYVAVIAVGLFLLVRRKLFPEK